MQTFNRNEFYVNNEMCNTLMITTTFKLTLLQKNQKRSDDRRIGREWSLICKRV